LGGGAIKPVPGAGFKSIRAAVDGNQHPEFDQCPALVILAVEVYRTSQVSQADGAQTARRAKSNQPRWMWWSAPANRSGP